MKRSRIAVRVFGAAALGVTSYGCAAPQTIATMPNVVAPAATPPGAGALGIAPGPQAPGPVTVWDKLGMGKQQREFCRRKLCSTPMGMLMGRAIAPMSALTGGLIGLPCSPIPTLAQLLDPGAIGANSKVKMDKANAEARKAAVEELASVDCHYWPEAEDALIGALRADRNECVRHTAALALNRGCCCTKKTIEALNICVSGSEADGHPCEKSPRVRAAAALALQHCLERACCPTCPIPEGAIPVPAPAPVNPEEKPKGEGEATEKKDSKETDPKPTKISWAKPSPYEEDLDEQAAANKQAKAYYKNIRKKSYEELQNRAKHVLATMPPLPADLSIPAGHPDYEAAGVRTTVPADGGPRPSNVLDMLTGKGDTAKQLKYNMATPVIKTAAPKSTAEAPIATEKAMPAVKPAEPANVINSLSGKAVEPTMPTPAPMVSSVKAVEPTMPTPAPIVSPVVAKTSTEIPASVDKFVETTPFVIKEPIRVEPKAMPTTQKAITATPTTSKWSTKADPKKPVVPQVTKSVEKPTAKTSPVNTVATTKNSDRVMQMFHEPTDLKELCSAVDSLTDADLKGQAQLASTLLREAEDPYNPALRVSCLKALARTHSKDAEIATRLKALSNNSDKTVAHEAAKTLKLLGTGK